MVSRLRWPAALSTLLVLAAVARIGFSYGHTAQTFDEPCHISAGIEFLDKKTYTLDPVHPPLSRIAIALPLYAAGERYPKLPVSDPDSYNYNVVGNHILYDSGHFTRNLMLARMGVLPFFVLGALIVYLWAVRIGGERAGLFAVLLYTTTPTILAFSSIAYTDIVAASTQVAALFAFYLWLEDPTRVRLLWFGLSLGFAFLAKLTSVLFLPVAGLCMFLVWLLMAAKREELQLMRRARQGVGALAIAAVIVWGGYRFSLKPIQEVTGLSPSAMPSFQHFPAFARSTLQRVVIQNPRLPAPELLHGVAVAWVLNKSTSASYLFGHIKAGGWWYFYLCALAVKLPLPLLILFGLSVALLLKEKREAKQYLPLAALLGVLLITTGVSYQVGIRHILVGLPLIAIVAATGLQSWLNHASWRSAATLLLLALTAWQIGESAKAQGNFLAYFNELSGNDPSKILSTGCDLDCGQDLYYLVRELQSHHVSKVTLAVWTSADLDKSGLPAHDLPTDNREMPGWIAVSSRAYRCGDFDHRELPPHSFDWLDRYSPVASVGRTIKLYYINASPRQN
jgi:hypothetical protein